MPMNWNRARDEKRKSDLSRQEAERLHLVSSVNDLPRSATKLVLDKKTNNWIRVKK